MRRFSQFGFSTLDVVLVVVIVTSISVIGYRLYSHRKPRSVGEAAVSALPPGPEALPALGQMQSVQNERDSTKALSDAAWKQFVAMPSIAATRVQRSTGCLSARLDADLLTSRTSRAELFESGALNTIFPFLRMPCLAVGQKVDFWLFDRSPEAPLAKLIGSAQVEDVLVLPITAIPEILFEQLGNPREKVERYLAENRTGSAEPFETIVRLSTPVLAAKTGGDVERPPKILPRGFYIERAELKIWLAKHPAARLVDVRSAAEFAKGSLPGAINLPYEVPKFLPQKQYWKNSRVSLFTATFDLAAVLEMRKEYVVFFGANHDDPRPFFATFLLQDASFTTPVWIGDGMGL